VTDRRRARRIAIREEAEGVLYLSEDIVVERVSRTEITVLSSAGVAQGEELQVWLHHPDGESEAIVAKAIERTPALVDGMVRHRVRLSVLRPKEAQ
jgi:hypothetical protein